MTASAGQARARRGAARNPVRRRPRERGSTLEARLRRVRLLLTDVDGVMTDGNVFVSDTGEFKQFSIQDGLGLVLLRRCGVKVGWISVRPSAATSRRAEELHIDFLSQEAESKVKAAEKILAATQLRWAEVCYVGDDVVDLCLLKRAGVAMAVSNAIAEAKAMADYVTKAAGGQGAVREIATMILKAQGQWQRLINAFTE